MLPPIPYPNSSSVIKPTNKTLPKVMAATNAAHATVHKAAINSLGGVSAVAGTIFAAITSAPFTTIGSSMLMMTQMMKMMQMMQSMQLTQMTQITQPTQWNAVYAIMLKLI